MGGKEFEKEGRRRSYGGGFIGVEREEDWE